MLSFYIFILSVITLCVLRQNKLKLKLWKPWVIMPFTLVKTNLKLNTLLHHNEWRLRNHYFDQSYLEIEVRNVILTRIQLQQFICIFLIHNYNNFYFVSNKLQMTSRFNMYSHVVNARCINPRATGTQAYHCTMHKAYRPDNIQPKINYYNWYFYPRQHLLRSVNKTINSRGKYNLFRI
jgi:hypothetical protein